MTIRVSALVLALILVTSVILTGACVSAVYSMDKQSKDIHLERNHLRQENDRMDDLIRQVKEVNQELESFLETWELEEINPGDMSSTQREFVHSISPGAVSNYHDYGVLPSITIAQAILESGWGRSYLAIKGNNIFGIKGSSRGSISIRTSEYINGQYIQARASFRTYDDVSQSIKDHGHFLSSRGRYDKVLGAQDYHEAAKALQKAGYATDPHYANKLINLIERYQLQDFDDIALTGASVGQVGNKFIMVRRNEGWQSLTAAQTP